MKPDLNPSSAITDAAATAAKNLTAAAKINPTVNTELLGKILANPDAKLDFMDRKVLVSAIKGLNNGHAATRIITSVGKALGRVITASEARKVLEARLNAQVSKQAIKSNEAIQKKAIEAGIWNNGINYVSTPNANATSSNETASGQDGNTQHKTIGETGSYLGG